MLGIVILNYVTYNKTIECVESIIENISKIDYQIYIVDNASPNESYDYLNDKYNHYKNIHVLNTKENIGFARGNNLGISKAMKDGIEYIILTNNDILFKKNSINRLYEFIKLKKDAVIVGPRIYTPNGDVQHSSSLVKSSYYEVLGLNFLVKDRSSKVLDEINLKTPKKVYTVSGCCFIISASKFKKMRGFDENTFLYNEENIIGSQAEKNNYNTYFYPTASIVHHHGATTGKQNLFVARELLKSSLYYWRAYREGTRFGLIIIYLTHTFKGLIKTLYIKEYRKGWRKYFNQSLKDLLVEVRKV
jgi:GT2 family glycosyltransferase